MQCNESRHFRCSSCQTREREHLLFPSLAKRVNRMLKKSANGHSAWGVTSRVKQSLTLISPDPKELGTAVTSKGS